MHGRSRMVCTFATCSCEVLVQVCSQAEAFAVLIARHERLLVLVVQPEVELGRSRLTIVIVERMGPSFPNRRYLDIRVGLALMGLTSGRRPRCRRGYFVGGRWLPGILELSATATQRSSTVSGHDWIRRAVKSLLKPTIQETTRSG